MNRAEKIRKFASKIANAEGGKSQANIGDVRQTLKLIDKELGGMLYAAIDLLYTEVEPAQPVISPMNEIPLP